ncbi:hypothetical protein QBC45DRAFT_395413 [Copromyces sp. CBS 386.78]|nr:hypothetical protein QBC45DRAFT_395413 [Copromyces sp. CBS 386.78]
MGFDQFQECWFGKLPHSSHRGGNSQQDCFARLKPESRALAKSVASKVDPQGLFRDRTGGWKP